MRAALVLSSISILALACGSPPPPAAIAPQPLEVTAPSPPAPPPPPPLPPEPTGLVSVRAPASTCELRGAISGVPLGLAASADGAPFAHVSKGTVVFRAGSGGKGVIELVTPSLTLRGFSDAAAIVHPAKWIAFGNVYFPGNSSTLRVKDANDSTVTLIAPAMPGLTLGADGQTASAACADLSLAIDRDGALAKGAPPSFLPSKDARPMILKSKKPVSISADATGPEVATIDATSPLDATWLEQRGKRARIRIDHLAGWIDAAALSKPSSSALDPHLARQAALRDAAQFGMIGVYHEGSNEHVAPPRPPPITAKLTCDRDVRLIVETGTPATRVVVGAIPGGKLVRVTERGPELTRVSITADGIALDPRAHFSVPSLDLAVCKEVTVDDESVATAADDASGPHPDAIDALDPTAPRLGVAQGIGIGNIGTGTWGGNGSTPPTGAVLGNGSNHVAPSLRQGAVAVNGRLPPEVIQRIVRQNFGRFRLCYENGLRTDPTLGGRIAVKFTIDGTGAVKTAATDATTDLPDSGVKACVVRGFGNLAFPQPDDHRDVTVIYPIIFAPGS